MTGKVGWFGEVIRARAADSERPTVEVVKWRSASIEKYYLHKLYPIWIHQRCSDNERMWFIPVVVIEMVFTMVFQETVVPCS